ncbi:MAG: RNA polymerase factor sigma-32 [Aquamicrobium sp.]|uniref:RNA polymerase factor sigma-32 n=1 Tax=Aquamicrobium sp. TaxID=1872579 RepID=UPI00349EF859|nr:RNA polymerase factor sigma-32 [Aquamicrobium sp.]
MDDLARRGMIRQAMRAPYLTRDEELALALRWKERRDQEALNRIALAHMRLVVAMAGRFRHFGLSASDLIQEGHIGLLEAAARFDPDREVRFSTYAAWWVRASMQDFILRNWSIVRGGTSSGQKALFFNLRRLKARLAREHGDNVPRHELHTAIAEALGIRTSDVAAMDARLSAADCSLDAPVAGPDGERPALSATLVSDAPLPEEVVARTIDGERRRHWLDRALSTLNPRELKIIRERRLSEEGETLEALGRRLGISKERVRQIESRAMEKLRAALVRSDPDRMSSAA